MSAPVLLFHSGPLSATKNNSGETSDKVLKNTNIRFNPTPIQKAPHYVLT